jgi:fatty-acid desaturase
VRWKELVKALPMVPGAFTVSPGIIWYGLVKLSLAFARQGMRNSIAHDSGGCQVFRASLALL